jgi:hypothetical protein
MTPNLAIVRIETGHWWGFPIPLPVFLLWIPALLLGPFVLLILWAVCLATRVSFLATVATMWRILCSLPGTDVRVCTDGNRVTVRIL